MSLNHDAYAAAQNAMAALKSAVYKILQSCNEKGLTNASVSRALGIYRGHVKHEGHISRTILEMMQEEGVAKQLQTKRWRLRISEEAD